jgi:transcriptional regulator with XRE-family HTH domain
MIIDNMADEFADLLGNALAAFLKTEGIPEAEAARRMGIGRATLNTYTIGVKEDGKDERERRRPPAELLARACVALGFQFEFEDHIIVARKKGKQVRGAEKKLHLEFTREIDLADNGAITVGLKKPPGKIELSVSLRELS